MMASRDCAEKTTCTDLSDGSGCRAPSGEEDMYRRLDGISLHNNEGEFPAVPVPPGLDAAVGTLQTDKQEKVIR